MGSENSIQCKHCGSPNVVKYGTFEGVQRYWCMLKYQGLLDKGRYYAIE